jgi:selenocysteine-specific elongation factor
MVAGATGTDLFLVCIAADDGVMPQTREHVAVLRQLGVERGVVAITKADLADPAAAADAAAELLPGVDIVTVATPRREGLDELRQALDRAAGATPSRAADPDAPARLHVDRSFTLKGIGTVVTGTLWSGSIGAGDQVSILPAGQGARVRSVQVHDEPVDRAAAGQRVAVNLVGLHRDEVGRGDVLVRGLEIEPAFILDARVELEPGARVETGTRLQVHHGTRESAARVYLLGDGFMQLRLEQPIVALRGDHVILRRVAPPDTIGGAVVIEAPARRHSQRPEVVERLRAIEAGGSPDEAAKVSPGRRGQAPGQADARTAADAAPPLGPAAVALRDLLRADGERPRTDGELAEAASLDPAAASAAFRALEADGSAVRVARNLHFDAEALAALVARVADMCERDGSATIAGVRDELGTSRKYAQALLEHMDAARITLRRDDEHVLRRAR